MQTTGNTILITGGGSGIGRGLAEAFHRLGNQMIISGRTAGKLEEVTVGSPGMAALTVDMTDAGSVAALAERAVADFPQLNAVFHVAGIMANEDLRRDAAASLPEVEQIIATNLLGVLRLNAALLPHLMEQEQATIMTVSSGLAFVPLAMTPTYCATKAAVHSYTQSLRYQLHGTGVQVLELIPPYVQTTLMGERQKQDPMAMPLEEYLEEVMALLTRREDGEEINVQRVLPLRNAAEGGRVKYRAFFTEFNDKMVAARPNG